MLQYCKPRAHGPCSKCSCTLREERDKGGRHARIRKIAIAISARSVLFIADKSGVFKKIIF